jgi:hypothetical protein
MDGPLLRLTGVNQCTAATGSPGEPAEKREDSADQEGTVESWPTRKQQYLDHLGQTNDPGILRVSCADKLHNARSILVDYEEDGEAIWERFRSRTKAQQIWYYESLADMFESKTEVLNDSGLRRLSGELRLVVGRIESMG